MDKINNESLENFDEKEVEKVKGIIYDKDFVSKLLSLKDIEVVCCIAYLFPQVGQKRLWQRKGTNLRWSQ